MKFSTRTLNSFPQTGAFLGRRTLLQASMFGAAGLSAGSSPFGRIAAADRSLGENGFGQAKQCLLLFMWGGPSQLDTFDPKPEAPDSVRGPFKPIATNVPGIDFSENFRMLSSTCR